MNNRIRKAAKKTNLLVNWSGPTQGHFQKMKFGEQGWTIRLQKNPNGLGGITLAWPAQLWSWEKGGLPVKSLGSPEVWRGSC